MEKTLEGTRPTADDCILINSIISSGQTITKTCELLDISRVQFGNWMNRKPDFRKMVDLAKSNGVDAIMQECRNIADDTANDIIIREDGRVIINTSAIAIAKLRIDTRMRIARYLAPLQFAEARDILKYRQSPEKETDSLPTKIKAARDRVKARHDEDAAPV